MSKKNRECDGCGIREELTYEYGTQNRRVVDLCRNCVDDFGIFKERQEVDRLAETLAEWMDTLRKRGPLVQYSKRGTKLEILKQVSCVKCGEKIGDGLPPCGCNPR